MEALLTSTPAPVHAGQVETPDPEVPERPKRRRFSAEYKAAILNESDAAPPGEVAAILRREGLYSSHLAAWKEQRRAGSIATFSTKRGPKPDPMAKEVAKLRRENARLRKDLENARLVIDVQKKVSRLLGTTEPDEEH